MKKILFPLLLGIICAVIGGLFGLQVSSQKVAVSQQKSTLNRIATPTPKPSIPDKLHIPKLGIDARVESVAMDKAGAMDVPKGAMNVAWYNLGAKPGEKGSAVIAGHLDSKTGAPEVFWDLDKLSKGDEIEIIDAKGKTYTFAVTDQKTFEFDKVPLQDIFANTNGTFLNLITCEGTFDKSNKNYSKRLVVYSQLKT